MEILPSDYQHLELSKTEKIFVRYIMSQDVFGCFLLNVNPAMQEKESMHMLVTSSGVVLFKFMDNVNDASKFSLTATIIENTLFAQTKKIVVGKLKSNVMLRDEKGNLSVPLTICYIFPQLSTDEINLHGTDTNINFVQNHCLFKNDILRFRTDFNNTVGNLLGTLDNKDSHMVINDRNVNSILQKLTPEYTTIRTASISDAQSSTGAPEESLVVDENDEAVRAFRLDKDQINIVNKITKGEQLILACAGSGKSVLLISKCFKAAEMNPDKQFLITCYNKNLCSLYTWFIDRAGLKERNVTCLTFHSLCKQLLLQNHFPVSNNDFDSWVNQAISRMNKGSIKQRFYGVFIDEVQEFDTEWYKLCFNLLENKNTDDHLFVICGDKTQKLKNQQRHGKAPWNAGEGYPMYRGGNKNIRIEKNYRNCIEINEYINRYVSNAKNYLRTIDNNYELDPDMFLRGQSFYHGFGVQIDFLLDESNRGETNAVIRSIEKIHDDLGIPYDEIAVVMNNGKYNKQIKGWQNRRYNIEELISSDLYKMDIPFCKLYSTQDDWGEIYGDSGGVRLIKFDSVLGLDFRAVIVCGLITLGEYDQTKKPSWKELDRNEEDYEEVILRTQDNIRRLYVACTRAKEVLNIIIPDSDKNSVYMDMLQSANQ